MLLFTMEVTFQSCQVLSNRQGPISPGGIPLLGVLGILTPFNPTVFRNCIFEGNVYDGSDRSQNGYAIQSRGSPLTVEDSCFIDNDLNGFGPVQVKKRPKTSISYG